MYFIFEAILITGIAFVRYRAALLFFTFLLALSPRSTSIAIGQSGLAFSFTRYALLVMLGCFIVKLMRHPKIWRRAKYALFQERSSTILILLAGLKLSMSFYATGVSSLPYIFDDVSITLMCFLIFYVFTKTQYDFRKLLVAMTLSVLLSGLLGLIEASFAKPLVTFLASGAVAGSDDVLAGITRNSSYRLQALFDNPLLLAEFTVLATPLIIYLFHTASGFLRMIWAGAMFVAAALLVGTGSRAGLILYAIEIPAIFVLSRRGDWGFLLKLVAAFVVVTVIGVALYSGFDSFMSLAQEGKTGNFWLYDDEDRSTLERASQYLIVFEQMKNNPFFGFGVRQSLHNELDFLNRLDSYWLRLLLEGGIFAPLLFIGFAIVAIRRVIGSDLIGFRKPPLLRAALLVFIAMFVSLKLFISIPSNNIYFFIVIGAFFGVTQKPNKVWSDAHSACP
ncbi:O-antigen ligase family protein [Phaeovulum sp.]|uniref:O-antigen ligase family protein n=1 Tax=Phaeovulum sp. TaxID=2934796 RepID=UPI0039E45D2F